MLHPLRGELRAILKLAGPLIAAQLAHVLMVFTDTVMMGLLGPATLAAGGLGAASYSFVSIFCVGVIASVGNLVAIRHGAQDAAGVTRLTQNGLWLGWGLALLAGLALWNLGPALLYFGQKPENVSGGMQFLSTLVFALPGYMSFMALRGFTSAIGRPGPVMAISIGGALANFVLNYALIKGWFGLPPLGLAGIGLVTAVVMNVMALLLAWHVLHHSAYSPYPLWRGLLRPAWAGLKELLPLGLATGGAPDRNHVGVRGVYGASGDFLRGDLPYRSALWCRPPAAGTPSRSPGPWPRCAVHARFRLPVLAGAALGSGAVSRPQRQRLCRGCEPGRGTAGDCCLVRVLRWHPDHRHGRNSRPQGRQDHLLGWPRLLLGSWRATGMGSSLPEGLGRRRRLVGISRRPGLRRHRPDPGF